MIRSVLTIEKGTIEMIQLETRSLKTDKEKADFRSDNTVKMFFIPSEYNLKRADRYEVWGTSFKHEGDDFTECRLYRGETVIFSQKVKGY